MTLHGTKEKEFGNKVFGNKVCIIKNTWSFSSLISRLLLFVYKLYMVFNESKKIIKMLNKTGSNA